MNFFIVGANFINKGAESMLFTCVGELKKRFPDCTVYYKSFDPSCNEKAYCFKFVFFNDTSQNIALDKIQMFKVVKEIAKSTIKSLLLRGNVPFEIFELKHVMDKIDCIIDVSGYCLTSKWGLAEHRDYYDNFELAEKYNIPIVLFPQSFGPFDYIGNKMFLDHSALPFRGRSG